MSKRSKKKARNEARKDPAYMVRESEMRDHIERLLKNDPLVQELIKEEARRANLAEAKEQDKEILALFLMTLHKSEGFGRKRLLRVAKALTVLQDYYEGRYKECDMTAIIMHLRDHVGVDVRHIDEEVAKLAEENTN